MKELILVQIKYQIWVASFRRFLQIEGYASSSVYNQPHLVQEFLHYCEQQEQAIEQINTSHYFEYLKNRSHQRKGNWLKDSYLKKHVQALNNFGRYLQQTEQGELRVNIRLKSSSKAIQVLSEQQIQCLYELTGSDILGMRDKAILDVYYGCGLRRSEAEKLNVEDVNMTAGWLHVRKGKGGKSRLVPLNTQLQKSLGAYVRIRKLLLKNEAETALILSEQGKRLQGQSMAVRIKLLGQKTGIDLHPHQLRHSIATHLLHNGLSLKQIALFLGHASLEATQIYTHL